MTFSLDPNQVRPVPPAPTASPSAYTPLRSRRSYILIAAAAATVFLTALVTVAAVAVSAVRHHGSTHALSAPTAPATAPATDAAPPADDGPHVFGIGETAQATASDGSAFTMRVSAPAYRSHDVVITFDMACSAGKVPYNPFYFKIKDSEGTEYDWDPFGGGTLHSGDLYAGQKVHGTVAFQAPRSAMRGGQVEVSDAGLDTVAIWMLG